MSHLVLLTVLGFSAFGSCVFLPSDPQYIINTPLNDLSSVAGSQNNICWEQLEIVSKDPTSADGVATVVASSLALDCLKEHRLNFTITDVSKPLSQDPLFDGYLQSVAAFREFLGSIANQHPNIAQMWDTSQYGGPTFEGRQIPMLVLGSDIGGDVPNILFNGNHHAREIVTPEIVMTFIRHLVDNYGSNQEITEIVDSHNIFFAPTINPDGYDYVWSTNNNWRKNRKPYEPTGDVGVDINRNYNHGWSGPCSGSFVPSSGTYKGIFPFSEAESHLLSTFHRDRGIAKLLDFHSSGREVIMGANIEGGCEGLTIPIDEMIQRYGRDLATASNYDTRRPAADGHHQLWVIRYITSYSFLIETHRMFQPPYESAVEECLRLIPMLMEALRVPISVTGHVLDGRTNEPVVARISVPGHFGAPENVHRFSEKRYGRFSLFLPDGSYQIMISADGFAPAFRIVSVAGDSQDVGNILLTAL